MTDYFALFNEARRPWLEPEPLKDKFLALSATVHPDRVHNLGEAERAAAHWERYTELNAAYNCLREPRRRVGTVFCSSSNWACCPKDIQRIPSDLMDLSMEIGKGCREADTFLVEKAKVTSPLLQVTFFERGHEFADKLQILRQRVNSLNERVVGELKQIDAAWPPPEEKRAAQFQRMEEIYRLLSYFARWISQIQERVVRVSF